MRNAFTTYSDATTMPLPESLAPETLVRCRILAWCSAWSSVNGALPTESLRGLAAPGAICLSSDLKGVPAASESFEDYTAVWAPWLADRFESWTLVLDGPIKVRVQEGVAATDFHNRFLGMTHDGGRLHKRQHAIQVWEELDGAWFLTQERSRISRPESHL